MKFLILGGAGVQGSASAYDLLRMHPDAEIILGELEEERLDPVLKWLDSDRAQGRQVDVRDVDGLARMIVDEGCDVIISSVPWPVSIPPLEAAIKAGADFVDYGLYQNREFDRRMDEFDRRAADAGVTVIPSCGVAPGLTNMLAAYGAAGLDAVDRVHIYVGGIPEHPEPPLQYKAVWSLEGVWTQFFEECRVVQNGRLTEVDAGTGLEQLEFAQTGPVEAAVTDGLGTLIQMYTHPVFEGVEEVFEKTIRHRGHYDKVLLLKECGLLDTEPIEVDGSRIAPRDFLSTLLNPKLKMREDERDMTVLRVRVTGTRDGAAAETVFEMVDYKDMEAGVLSMGRTTGYTGSILAPMVATDRIDTAGVVHPEKIGADRELFRSLLEEYTKRGIEITQRS